MAVPDMTTMFTTPTQAITSWFELAGKLLMLQQKTLIDIAGTVRPVGSIRHRN